MLQGAGRKHPGRVSQGVLPGRDFQGALEDSKRLPAQGPHLHASGRKPWLSGQPLAPLSLRPSAIAMAPSVSLHVRKCANGVAGPQQREGTLWGHCVGSFLLLFISKAESRDPKPQEHCTSVSLQYPTRLWGSHLIYFLVPRPSHESLRTHRFSVRVYGIKGELTANIGRRGWDGRDCNSRSRPDKGLTNNPSNLHPFSDLHWNSAGPCPGQPVVLVYL